jgi:hypothetical protein
MVHPWARHEDHRGEQLSVGLPCGRGVAGEQYRPGPVQRTVELERPDLDPEGTVVAVVGGS